MATSVILLFSSTQSVLKAEELLLEHGVEVDVVPRPPGTSTALCGIALELSAGDFRRARALLSEAEIGWSRHRATPALTRRVRVRPSGRRELRREGGGATGAEVADDPGRDG